LGQHHREAHAASPELSRPRRKDCEFLNDRQVYRIILLSSGNATDERAMRPVPNNAAHNNVSATMRDCSMALARRLQCPSACLSMPATRRKPG
jgi:hypothetical protein